MTEEEYIEATTIGKIVQFRNPNDQNHPDYWATVSDFAEFQYLSKKAHILLRIKPDPIPGPPVVIANLRDWYAGQLMAGYASIPDERRWPGHNGTDQEVRAAWLKWSNDECDADAEAIYRMADAMMKAREKKEGKP